MDVADAILVSVAVTGIIPMLMGIRYWVLRAIDSTTSTQETQKGRAEEGDES